MPSSGIAGSYGSFIPSFLRNFHTLLHSGFISWHSHQQVKEGSLFSTSSPAFIVHRFLMMAILTGAGWFVVVVVQSLSHVRLFAMPWAAAHQNCPSFTFARSSLKLMSIESVMPSNYLILCHSLLRLSISPSIRVFSNESALYIKWPKYWSFSISPSNEYSGLISFRTDGFDLLAVQRTLKSLQHHSSKASGLWQPKFISKKWM